MGWKNLPSWLKGGIIALILLFFMWAVAGSFFVAGDSIAGFSLILLALPFIGNSYLIEGVFGIQSESVIIVLSSSLLIIEFFIIGAYIGLLVGKFRSRK